MRAEGVGLAESDSAVGVEGASERASEAASEGAVERASASLLHAQCRPPLQAFAHALEGPVGVGLCAFALANAGVRFESVGALTLAVFLALAAGSVAPSPPNR